MEELKSLPYSSIIGALEYQVQTQPDKLAILYPDRNENFTKYSSLTYKQYNNVLNHLAGKIEKYLPSSSSNELLTCALLAVGGIEYLLSQYALLKLPNVIMFPISARNSSSAVEHLLKESKTILLLTKSEYLPMIETIQKQDLQILLLDSEEFQLEELLKNKDVEYFKRSDLIPMRKSKDEELNQVVIILHSSGSTAHPKAIRITNRYFLISFTLYSSINKDFWREDDVILSWGALFHLLAFNGTVRSIMKGCTYALPLCATFPPKPEELIRNIQVKNGITILITVPSLLEQLTRELLEEKNEEIGLKPLQKLRFIMYGGAGCPEDLCRTLVNNGVVLISVYGATETGIILVGNFDPYDKKWKSMEIPHVRKDFLRIESPKNSQNPNEKVIIHLSNDPFLAENISNSPDGSYTVGDIILEDPPNCGKYFILGRQDDTLVHLNGEKSNPIPMEDIIRRSPVVQQVIIVGQNQFCTGALIQLNIEEASNYDFQQIEQIIWESVERANEESPSHSRLVRQLVYILPMKKILPLTDKGNLMRQKIHLEYSTLINQIYATFFNQQYQEKTLKNNEKKQSKWTKENLEKFLQDKFQSFGIKEKDFSRSIFDFGINSLQIVELRNLISQNICLIPEHFLYEFSSIDQIIEQLIKYLNSSSISNEQNYSVHYQLTEDIIDKYIERMKQDTISLKKKQFHHQTERLFLITGANGSLGNFVIKDLLEKPQSIVKRIYCLLRGSNPKQRLFQSFEQRQFDTSLFINSLDKRLIVLPSSMNLTEEYLGQREEIYEELKSEVTDIIHLAWKMNFNQTIKDFQSDSIEGVYHLLKLASFNQKQFHFISSISSAASGLLAQVKEEPLPRIAQIALPQGYGLSKYASEHICWAAQHLWNVPMNIYRIGQVSGDTINGVWNKDEMAAMIIYAGAGQLKKIPNIGKDINWIPVDICSSSLVYLILNSSFDICISNNQRVYHLLNPHSISYEQYLNYLRESGLHFSIVSTEEFLQTIRETNDQRNPLIKLSSFIEQLFIKKDTNKSSTFQIVQTVQKCPILNNCPSIDSNLIQLYLNYWRKCQLLEEHI